MSLIICEKPNENLVLLRLNRPDVRNALSPELREELRDAVLSLDADPQVRAIVMTGGETIFAAGADIRSLVDTGPAEMMARDDEANWAALRQCSTPIVAAVNGEKGVLDRLLGDVQRPGQQSGEPDHRRILGVVEVLEVAHRWSIRRSRVRSG